MKRFLTLFILFTFCFNPICFAEEVFLQKPAEEIVVKTIDEKDLTLQKYNKKYRKYIKGVRKSIYEWDENGLFHNDNTSVSDKAAAKGNVVKIELQDGDYIVENFWDFEKGKKRLNEFHKDGKFMGYIDIHAKGNAKTMVMYEYRINPDTTVKNWKPVGHKKGEPYFTIKHIAFAELSKSKDKNKPVLSQFVYLENGKLLCYQINNEIFVAEGQKNLIPQMKTFNYEVGMEDTLPAKALGAAWYSMIVVMLPVGVAMLPLGLWYYWIINGCAKSSSMSSQRR